MLKAMPQELKEEIRDVLKELLDGGAGKLVHNKHDTPRLRSDAINHLADKRAIVVLEHNHTGHRLTAQGRDYWEKLTAPRWYWFRHNWFPGIVAAATIAASIGGIVFNALD